MSANLIAAGQRVSESLPFTAETALAFERTIDAITGRTHSLLLNDEGMPQSVGSELNRHIGNTLIRMGRMNEQAEAQGRTNDRSRAAIAAFEAAVAEI